MAIVAVINSVLPAVSKSTGSLLASSNAVQDRIASQIEIVHATGEDGEPDAVFWVKNVGAAKIAPIDRIDIFFGATGDFERMPYGTDSSCAAPCWYDTLETGTEWGPTATLRITVKATDDLASGTTYYMKIVTPNGTVDSKYMTV